jgi:hypothetical protein
LPFLIGTVALSGIVIVLQIDEAKREIIKALAPRE